MQDVRRRLFVYAVPYIIIASFQYQFAKDGLRYADPMTFMAARYLIAVFATFLFARSFRPRIDKDTILLALSTFLSTLMWIYGLQRVSPAQSALLSYTMPLFVIPFSTLILNEGSSRLGWMGALIGFVGVAIYGLTFAGSGGTILGATLTIGNAVFWAFLTVYYRKMRNQDATTTIGTQLLLGWILFSVLAPFDFAVTVTPEFLVNLSFVSIISGFCPFIVWNAMLQREKVGRITTLTFAVPAMTTMIESIETGAIPVLGSGRCNVSIIEECFIKYSIQP